jgi:3-deoxy-D-arabino-heptulosonate 7-phosphate (DAHP) synthase class II
MENGPAKIVRTRRSRAEIAELIATYLQSGQKQREFCQQRGTEIRNIFRVKILVVGGVTLSRRRHVVYGLIHSS